MAAATDPRLARLLSGQDGRVAQHACGGSAMLIEVHRHRLELDQEPSAADLAVLSAEERERVGRFVQVADRVRAAAGRAALRRLLGGHLGRPPASLVFTTTAHGKPLLADAPVDGPAFNLSHSGRWIYLAVAWPPVTAVGIDVEEHRRLEDPLDLARQVGSPSEQALLAALPADQRDAAFHRLWVRKEALVKALGTGLSHPLTTVSVLGLTGGTPLWHATPGPVAVLADLPAAPGCSAAVAVIGLRDLPAGALRSPACWPRCMHRRLWQSSSGRAITS